MKPHPRIRKTVKWASAAAAVLLLAVWLTSSWVTVGYRQTLGTSFFISGGNLVIERTKMPRFGPLVRLMPGWHVEYEYRPAWHNCEFVGGRPYEHMTNVHLLSWAMLAAIASAVAWRFDVLALRRPSLGRCPKCDYDLTGLLDKQAVRCPECGWQTRSA